MQSLRTLVYQRNGHFGNKIAMPYKIGCCRGGADWDKVYKMIEEIFQIVMWNYGD